MAARSRLQTPRWRQVIRAYTGMALRLGSDPSILLRSYAFLAVAAAVFLLYTTVDSRLSGVAEAVFGTRGPGPGATFAAMLVGVGLCARVLASAEAATTIRGLEALASAHMILAMVMLIASRNVAQAPAAVWAVMVFGAVFAYLGQSPRIPDGSILATVLTHFGRRGRGVPPPAEPATGPVMAMRSRGVVIRDVDGIRSAYERQIREAAQQEERHRLARDLHDAVKQQVFVVQTAAATAQERFDRDPDGARRALAEIRQSARAAMGELEAMLDQLQARALEPTGLVESLRRQGEALRFRTGTPVDLHLGALPPAETLAPGATQALLRIAQEALANVGRHARPTHVEIWFGWTGDGVTLSVKDDGAGFATEAPRGGMGLASMAARTNEFGGLFEIVSSPGNGTTVTATLPAESSTARADQHLRFAVFYGGAVLLVLGISLLRAWQGETVAGLHVVVAIALLALGAGHLGAYRRLRTRRAVLR